MKTIPGCPYACAIDFGRKLIAQAEATCNRVSARLLTAGPGCGWRPSGLGSMLVNVCRLGVVPRSMMTGSSALSTWTHDDAMATQTRRDLDRGQATTIMRQHEESPPPGLRAVTSTIASIRSTM
jgi:hypothetical protein